MRVLLIDQDTRQSNQINESLAGEGYEVFEVSGRNKALEYINNNQIAIVIAAYGMSGFPGEDLVADVIQANTEIPPFIIFLVEEGSQQGAVDCLAPISGDYMIRPVSPDGIRARIVVAKRSIDMRDRLDRVRRDGESLALYDQLTGILNRQAVYDQALAEISRAQREKLPLCVAMLEISNLQQIEAEYNVEIRDQVLRYVSSAVRANVRIYDILGRWIGAKFLLMLPNTNVEDASSVVERVNESIATINIELPDSRRLEITVNFGVSSLPPGETVPLYMLVEQANTALLEANSEVKNQVVYFEE
ncbi:MAG: diguanylate cyclase [Chloroflexi bacterium]|nr:diguanylate cyclase [Chloroflexota bacterium]